MNWEPIAIALIFICFFIIIAELIWLYILAENLEAKTKKYDEAYVKINDMYDSILTSPTHQSLTAEVRYLKRYIGKDITKLDIISGRILNSVFSEDFTENQKDAVKQVYNEIDPISVYKKLLKTGNPYQKAYSCRKIADFFSDEGIEEIKNHALSKNRDLSYNAGMALSVLGEKEAVAEYILSLKKNYRYSYRIILEILENYSGDITVLARYLMEEGDDYIKTNVIKSISRCCAQEFEDIYIANLSNKDRELKIASVKALGKIAKPKHEQILIIALKDKDWVVRNSAIAGLARIRTENSIKAIYEATKDPEWWIRYNAARALVNMDKDLLYIESVLKGYDKYAADAVKGILYKTL